VASSISVTTRLITSMSSLRCSDARSISSIMSETCLIASSIFAMTLSVLLMMTALMGCDLIRDAFVPKFIGLPKSMWINCKDGRNNCKS